MIFRERRILVTVKCLAYILIQFVFETFINVVISFNFKHNVKEIN